MHILQLSTYHLANDGNLFLEVDPSHPRLLERIVRDQFPSLLYFKTYKDFCNKNRFVQIKKMLN